MLGKSILIIDDNFLNLELITFLLTAKGYDVRTASNAKEALKVLKQFQPHLILMDIQLPDIDGFELTKQLKSDPSYKNILIIAVTAYAMKGDRERIMTAGCDGYIPKPIDTRTLPDIIEKYLRANTSI